MESGFSHAKRTSFRALDTKVAGLVRQSMPSYFDIGTALNQLFYSAIDNIFPNHRQRRESACPKNR